MTDLIEIPTEHNLLTAVPEVVLLEHVGVDAILETAVDQVLLDLGSDNTLLEPVERLVLLTESTQGPPGPAGADGTGAGAPHLRALRVDYASASYAYVGYATNILRIDYTVWPPAAQSVPVISLDDSWPLRTGLTYG